MNAPLITAIMPIGPRAHYYYPRTISSIQMQTFKDFECFCIPDKTPSFASENLQKYLDEIGDLRFKMIHSTAEIGVEGAFNTGIESSSSSSSYITFVGADDPLLPHRLQRHYDFLETNSEIGAVFGWVDYIDETFAITQSMAPLRPHNQTRQEWLRLMRAYNPLNACFMVRKIAIDQIGGFDPDLPALADLDFYIKCMLKSGIYVLEEVLSHFMIRPTQISYPNSENYTRHLRDLEIIKNRYPENVA